ncbi:hypothetical protein [Konateibacter massiliensis]|uniref:hypothetical protein n=1 Tax=Konateibacter massiliensis TaxID=2002841 RepID=UPI000C15F011|nr:hypothetical protein [Konateibacter massiliensis]
MIADEYGTDHHRIKRILEKNEIEITRKNRKRKSSKGYKRKPFTDEHRKNIGLAQKGKVARNKGKKMPKESLYKNILGHLHRKVSLEWLRSFEDIEKLKYLNHIMSRDRVGKNFANEEYINFIEYFYYNKGFNNTYDNWINENKAKYAKPSLDHIIPLSNGGGWDLSNLRIIPWCVNRAKFNYNPNEWEHIKHNYLTKEW